MQSSKLQRLVGLFFSIFRRRVQTGPAERGVRVFPWTRFWHWAYDGDLDDKGVPRRPSLQWVLVLAPHDLPIALGLVWACGALVLAFVVPAGFFVANGFYAVLPLAFPATVTIATILLFPLFPLLFSRLFIISGKINDNGEIDLTAVKHPFSRKHVQPGETCDFAGRSVLLTAAAGGPFYGRQESPVVTAGAYYRAKYKPDLVKLATSKGLNMSTVKWGLLAAIIISVLFIGLAASTSSPTPPPTGPTF